MYKRQEEKEPWLHDTKPACEVGVFITAGETSTPTSPALVEEGVYRMLVEMHIPFHFLNNLDDLDGYRLLILADHFVPDEKLAARLDAFVAAGGKLLITGSSAVNDGRFMLRCINAEFKGESEYDTRYIRLDPEIFADIPQIDHVLYERGYRVDSTDTEAAKIVPPYFNRTYQHFCSHRQTPPKRECSDEAAIIFGEGYVLSLIHI